VTTFIEHVWVNRHGIHGAPEPLLAVSPNRARPHYVLLLGPPDGYGVLRALAVLMPHLDDSLGVLLRRNLGLVVQAFRVVCRPHLQDDGDDRAPLLSDIMMRVGGEALPVLSGMEEAVALQGEKPGRCGSSRKGDQTLAAWRCARSR
jgi:hypothetical protein